MRLLLLLCLLLCASASSQHSGDGSVDWDLPPEDTTEAPQTPSSPDEKLQWENCPSAVRSADRLGWECATVIVPLCHDNACSKGRHQTHALSLVRYEVAKSAPTVWMTYSSSADETGKVFSQFARLQKLNLYMLESRLRHTFDGDQDAYSSYDAHCTRVSRKRSNPRKIDRLFVDGISKCKRWIDESFGVNGSVVYSLESAAKDFSLAMKIVKAQSLAANAPVFLYSLGADSRIVQRLMSPLASDELKKQLGIEGFIFDRPAPMTLTASLDKRAGDAATYFLSACSSDEVCKEKFAELGTTMDDALRSIYQQIDSPAQSPSDCLVKLRSTAYNKSRDRKASHGVRLFLAKLLSSSKSSAQVMAPLIYRIYRCSNDDKHRVQTVLSELERGIGGLSEFEDDTDVSLAEKMILVSELWPSPEPKQDDLIKSFESAIIGPGELLYSSVEYCAFTGSKSADCVAFDDDADGTVSNASHGIAYTRPKLGERANVTTGLTGTKDADVLVLTSRLSTMGSMETAEQLYTEFARGAPASQAVLLVQSDTIAKSEVTSEHSTTLIRLVELFVDKQLHELSGKWQVTDLASPKSKPKSTYATAPIAFEFTMSSADSLRWFGSSDPYEAKSSWRDYAGGGGESDDSCTDCSSTGLGLGWWLLVIMVIVAVVGLVLCLVVMVHQRNKEQQRWATENAERAFIQQQQYDRFRELQCEAANYTQSTTPSTLTI